VLGGMLNRFTGGHRGFCDGIEQLVLPVIERGLINGDHLWRAGVIKVRLSLSPRSSRPSSGGPSWTSSSRTGTPNSIGDRS